MPGYENLPQNPDSGSSRSVPQMMVSFAPPSDRIGAGTGTYPPWIADLGDYQYTCNPQSEENFVVIPSPDPQPIDSTPAFNFDDFVKDFGVSASQEPTEDTPPFKHAQRIRISRLTEQLGDPHLAL
ncbi:hypothetical protein BC826DRAFT_1192050 [Russula brevipes]|nr:hypothetical protein BC826DRAFT_1192050 [Russula brevipes]